MAGKGTYAAYGALKSVGDKTTENLRQAEYAGFKYREEEVAAKALKDKWVEDVLTQTGATRDQLIHKNTGLDGWDGPVTSFMMDKISEVNELEEKLVTGGRDAESQMRLNRINGSAKTIKSWSDGYSQHMKFNPETDSAYLFKKNNEVINARLKQGNYNIFSGKNGKLHASFYDENGEIDPSLPVLNLSDMVDNGFPPKDPKVTRKSAMVAIASEFGELKKTEELDGSITHTLKGFDPNNAAALRERADEFFGDDLKSITPAAQSIIYDDMGTPEDQEITEKDFEAIKDNFATAVQRMAATEDTEKLDRADQDRDRKFNYTVGQDALDREENAQEKADEKAAAKAKEDAVAPERGITIITNEQGNSEVTRGDKEKGTVKGANRFLLPEAAKILTPDGDIEIREIEMNGDKLTIKGTATTGTGKEKSTDEYYTSEATKISKLLPAISKATPGKNFNTLQDLYNHLNKVEKDTKESSEREKRGLAPKKGLDKFELE